MSSDAVADEDPGERPRSRNFKPLQGLLTFLWRHKLRLVAATVALVVTAMLQLSLGYGLQILIDEGFSAANPDGLRKAVVFIVSVGAAMAFGAMIRFYLVSWLGERVSADLRSAVFSNLVRLHPSYFESNQAGEIMSRLTTDTTLLQTLIGSSVSMAARNALSLLGALVMMLITNLKLSLETLASCRHSHNCFGRINSVPSRSEGPAAPFGIQMVRMYSPSLLYSTIAVRPPKSSEFESELISIRPGSA